MKIQLDISFKLGAKKTIWMNIFAVKNKKKKCWPLLFGFLFSFQLRNRFNVFAQSKFLRVLVNELINKKFIYEPAHDKTYLRLVQPAKTQISLRICAGWSESSLVAQVFFIVGFVVRWLSSSLIACAFYSLKAIQRGINENSCHTLWVYRLIWGFARHTVLIVCFVVLWLILFLKILRANLWNHSV